MPVGAEVVWLLANKDRAMTATEVAEELNKDRYSVSTTLYNLVEEGLLNSKQIEKDGRGPNPNAYWIAPRDEGEG
jgi:predicted transcriptional regulator